jgi:CBS domain-containing protein
MPKPPQALLTMTAGDLMSQNVVHLTEEMPLREAATLLMKHHVGGAPVVDNDGRCVGVWSSSDFLRFAVKEANKAHPPSGSGKSTFTCPFQIKQKTLTGGELIWCALPPGVCPITVEKRDPTTNEVVVSSQPHCMLAEWQLMELEKLPTNAVKNYMTANPVTVGPHTPIRFLARQMIDAHIHRVIVVDEGQRPIGIVSGTDVLAAVARAEKDE